VENLPPAGDSPRELRRGLVKLATANALRKGINVSWASKPIDWQTMTLVAAVTDACGETASAMTPVARPDVPTEVRHVGTDNDELVAEAPKLIDPIVAEEVKRLARSALEELETIQVDSKLDAFGALLTRLNGVATPHGRICVFAEYLSTLYYLAAEIEERGLEYDLVHGGMSIDDLQSSATRFSNRKSILVGTKAVATLGSLCAMSPTSCCTTPPTMRHSANSWVSSISSAGKLG